MEIPAKMKACLLTAVNKFEIREVPVPETDFGEVLCRVRAVAICGTDPEIVDGTHLARGWPPQYPFVMGHEWSGEVVKVGPGVTEFQEGDRVAGEAHKGCGICGNCVKGNYTLCLNYGKKETGHRHYGFTVPGANCEFNAYSIKAVKKIPDRLSFADASLVDTAGVALHGIQLIGITPGGTVAIYGPGPIGLCALQIARGLGAGNTIMVGRGRRLQAAKEIGADFGIDFEKEDPVKRIFGDHRGGGGRRGAGVLRSLGRAGAVHSQRAQRRGNFPVGILRGRENYRVASDQGRAERNHDPGLEGQSQCVRRGDPSVCKGGPERGEGRNPSVPAGEIRGGLPDVCTPEGRGH